MKKYIYALVSTLMLFSSCKQDVSSFSRQLDQHIAEAESIVNYYDQSVVSAMESGKSENITEQSKRAIIASNRVLSEVKNLNAPSDGKVLKVSAMDYIISLQNFIKVQEQYADFNDSTTLETTETMDAIVDSVYNNDVKVKHSRFLKIKEGVLSAK